MYTCPICKATAEDPTGWARAQITLTHVLSGDPLTVTADDALLVTTFDTDACRDAWLGQAGLAVPSQK